MRFFLTADRSRRINPVCGTPLPRKGNFSPMPQSTPTPGAPDIDPAVRAAIIAEEIAAGRIVRVSDLSDKSAEDKYRIGFDTLMAIARGEIPLLKLAEGTGAVLEANNQV